MENVLKEYDLIKSLVTICEDNNFISGEYYDKYQVKRGLRNENGTGVLVGLTQVANVHGYVISEGEKVPVPGELTYRGIDINKIVEGFQRDNRFGFEEVCYLLLLGKLPTKKELDEFTNILSEYRVLPSGFIEDMILKAPSNDIMNKLQRTILACYSYDRHPDDLEVKNVLRQSLNILSKCPSMIAYAYQAKNHYYEGKSLYIHSTKKNLSTAELILHLIRHDNAYTKTEVETLDLSLVIHAEHGGGNNSAFTTSVVTSTGTDTYSALASAVGSLKGPKHGGANIKVIEMIENIKANINDWTNTKEIREYLISILNKESFDKTGLIYGIGHAIYTVSDPRAVLLKQKAKDLAKEKNRLDEYALYTKIEEIAKEIFMEYRGKVISANVDFYSGFVYDMLNIPQELYTPIFAIARMAGWCAHRLEQLVSERKIIRPAYKTISKDKTYVDLNDR